MARVISIVNFKGGVGKTTSTVNIGAAIAREGYRVLLVDMDPQFNLSQSLGLQDNESSIYDSLIDGGRLPIENVQTRLDIVPSDIVLIRADIELAAQYKRETFLQKRLEPIKHEYSYILIDCPPALGILTQNAIEASSEIFTPVAADFLALKGYQVLSSALRGIGREINRAFITRYDSRKILNKNVLEHLRASLGEKLFQTVIRENVALAESPAKGKDIHTYSPGSYGSVDYLALTQEILKMNL